MKGDVDNAQRFLILLMEVLNKMEDVEEQRKSSRIVDEGRRNALKENDIQIGFAALIRFSHYRAVQRNWSYTRHKFR